MALGGNEPTFAERAVAEFCSRSEIAQEGPALTGLGTGNRTLRRGTLKPTFATAARELPPQWTVLQTGQRSSGLLDRSQRDPRTALSLIWHERFNLGRSFSVELISIKVASLRICQKYLRAQELGSAFLCRY